MRRGPGPPESSSPESPFRSASIQVNQSQGFDTSAFGTPQPSACEVSPSPPRRRTSGGGLGGGVGGGAGEAESGGGSEESSESTLRRSLELDRQQQETATFVPFSRGGEDGNRPKSSSGPISMQQQPQQQALQYALHHPQLHHHHQPQQSPPVGPTSPVRRTRSLKENLIKRFNSSVVSGAAGIVRAAGVATVAVQAQQPQSPKATAEDSPSAVSAAAEDIFSFDQLQAVLAARTGAAGSSRSSSPKKAGQEAAAKPQQQQPPTPMSRNRAGSLRGGSVVKVLPDKKLLNKASSSENLSQNAAAADLNSLASLVQKKRDRSQESLEQAQRPAAAGTSGGGGRKPPTPTPAADSDEGSDLAAASASSKSKPPSGIVRGGRRLESPTFGKGATSSALSGVAAAMASGPDDSPAEANDTDRESPVEDQQSDGEVPSVATGAGGGASAHNRSNSLEFLMHDAQSRTAPQIRHPSARKIDPPPAVATGGPIAVGATAAVPAARREGSPPKALSSGGSSPPKAVSFNPNDEVKTYEGDYSGGSRYRKHHRGTSSSHSQQPPPRQRRPPDGDRNGHAEAWNSGKIGDNALIEVHSAMVESMDKMVSKQRQFLCQVKDGSITVGEYREVMKSLLTMQTKTIHQILDAIQSNEKPS